MSIAQQASAGRAEVPGQRSFLANYWGLLAAGVVLIGVLLLPTPEALPVAGHRMLALLAFAVIIWMTDALDYAVSAVVIAALMASATALASAMIPIVIAVLQGVATPGINKIGMTMLLQFVVSFGFILVVNAPQNMVAYGTETFEARDFVRTGLVLTVIAFALVMFLGATYWRWLGYV
jgi:di/tricarboxylate transporter